jgi:ABC-type amino acid transport substrate-binding protein
MALIVLPLLSFEAKARDLRLCFHRWAPYAYDNGGGAEGLAVDLAREAFSRVGDRVTFVQMPVTRCRLSILYGTLDGMLFDDGDHAGEDKDAKGLLRAQYGLIKRVLVSVVRRSYPKDRFAGPETFAGANWLKVAGFDYPETAIAKDMHAVEVGENAQGLSMLRLNYVDVVFRDLASLRFGTDAPDVEDGLKILLPAVQITPCFLRLRTGLKAHMLAYDQAVKEMRREGLVDRLYYQQLGFSEVGFSRFISEKITSSLPPRVVMRPDEG